MHFKGIGITGTCSWLLVCELLVFLQVPLVTSYNEKSNVAGENVDQIQEHQPLDGNAVEYLERYGYLSRRMSDKDEDRTHSHVDKDHALRTFQTFANVNVTGELDRRTSHVMSRPRCGFVDILPNTDRTLPMKLENPAKWKSKVVKWKITVYSTKLTIDQQREAIASSVRVWTDNSGLTVEETSGDDADIEIQFATGDHGDGKMNAFDGKGRSVAHAFLPPDGRAHFDDDEDWTLQDNNGTELHMTAIHELGHSLGLIHSTARESIMAPFYKKYRDGFKLHRIDVEAIQELYGPPVVKEERAPKVEIDESDISNTIAIDNDTATHSTVNTNDITYTVEENNTVSNNAITNNTINNNETDETISNNTKSNNKIDEMISNNTKSNNKIDEMISNNTINNSVQQRTGTTTTSSTTKKKERFNICTSKIDAVCGGKDGHINLFSGRYVYKLYSYCLEGQNCVLEGYPRLIRSLYKKGPKRVHAAAYIPDVRKRTYLFRGRRVWRYTGSKLDPGYPVKLNPSDIPYKPTAAYAQKTPYADYQLYIFSGKYFWEMNMYTNKVAHRSIYYTETYWDHMPEKPDAITQTKDGNIYVFKNKHYRKYDYRRGIVSKKNLIAPAWIGRHCGFGNKDYY